MSKPAQVRQPSPEERQLSEQESQAARESALQSYIDYFSEKNPYRPYGRTHKELTVQDFQNLGFGERKGDNIFFVGALSLFAVEDYARIDRMKPDAMSREEFLHVMLREAQRRDGVGVALNLTGYITREDVVKTMTATRPLDPSVPAASKTTAHIPLADLAFRDIFTQFLAKPGQKNGVYEDDVVQRSGSAAKIDMSNDTASIILGYFVGANPAFNNAAGPNGPIGVLPLTVYYPEATRSGQVQATCSGAREAVKPGRAKGMDQNMAVSIGYLMAREDAKQAFSGTAKEISVYGQTCSIETPAWNASSMREHLHGQDKVIYDARRSATR